MPDYRFIYNLRQETFDPRFRRTLRPAGYLLAPNNATDSLRRMAADTRLRNRHRLFADNGNFSFIEEVRGRHAARARALFQQVGAEERRVGHSLRTHEAPPDLREAYRSLAQDSLAAAKALMPPPAGALAAQLALAPSDLIGVEDLTMAVWLSLNIEPQYLSYPRSSYRRLNAAVARQAEGQLRDLPRRSQSRYYPVASAMSHDTAFDAGQVFAAAGLRRISMGFGAYMADDNYSDHVVIRGRAMALPASMPNRYVRTVAAARGFWGGYKHRARRPPAAFHFLGLGAPIMIPLVSLCAWGTRELTFDATSPIRDAVEGFFYVSKPAYLKVRARNMAFRLASGERSRWTCPCPFCKEFVSRHPFDYDLGRSWFLSRGRAAAEAEDLRPQGELFEAYPLLSEPASGALRKAVSFARMGHNHWAIEQITGALRKNSKTQSQLRKHVANIVEDYARSTGSRVFGEAIRFAHRIATGSV